MTHKILHCQFACNVNPVNACVTLTFICSVLTEQSLNMGAIKMWGNDKKSHRKLTNWGNMKLECLIYVWAFQYLMISSDVLCGEKKTYISISKWEDKHKQIRYSCGSHITSNQTARLFQHLNKYALLFFVHCLFCLVSCIVGLCKACYSKSYPVHIVRQRQVHCSCTTRLLLRLRKCVSIQIMWD